MKILGIETSCDETSIAIIETNKKKELSVLSNVTSSSLPLHSKTGGIIPEVAAREQVKFIIPVLEKALADAKCSEAEIDSIAVTYGPGLIGSLLVGVETAKTLSFAWNKPIIPVNHLFGHIYANFISEIHNSEFIIHTSAAKIKFPLIGLIVSGGHTDLILMKDHGKIKWLGGTRDDAAGEAFDKIGRLLNLKYPAGPEIENLAKKGNPKAFTLPRPMIGSADFDFSFSGLKAAVSRTVILRRKAEESRSFTNVKAMALEPGSRDDNFTADICASTQEAIIRVLIRKTLKAAKQFKVKSILLGGGVAANQKLRDEFKLEIRNWKLEIPLFVPEKSLCTDNGAMIAAAAVFNYKQVPWKKIMANPELYFD